MKWLLPVATCLGIASAQAAVTPNSSITAQTPNRGIVQFLQGTDVAGTYKTLYTSSTNGSKCVAMMVTTTDPTATHLVTVQLFNTAKGYGGASLQTVASAGFSGTSPTLNLMSPSTWAGLPLDSDGNPFIMLASGDTLQATYATTLSSAAVINVIATCYDF